MIVIIFCALITPAIMAQASVADLPEDIPKKPGYINSIDELPFQENFPDQGLPNATIPTIMSDDIVEMIEQLSESMILEYLENLTSFGPRVTGTPACDQAAAYLYSEFEDMGLSVRYQNWSHGTLAGSNVEAEIPGTNYSSIYVVCAHYDSVAGSPGADDDGSGVVAVLALAEIMRQYSFDHTLRFVTFSGEEQGLYGSHYYVEEAYANGDEILGALNADMIAYTDDAEDGTMIQVFANPESEWIRDFTTTISELYYDYMHLTVVPRGFTWGSDHYSFWEFGYNAVFYHEYEFNAYYHSPEDTIEHCNITYSTMGSRLILATLAALADFQSTELAIGAVQGGFGIRSEIINVGDYDALDVTWNISVTGGIFKKIARFSEDTTALLAADNSLSIELKQVIGFGPIVVSVHAEAPFVQPVEKTVEGFILFVYILIPEA